MSSKKKYKLFIDPPTGWRYGFPKEITNLDLTKIDINKWLVENGYPQSELDKWGDEFYYRTFEKE